MYKSALSLSHPCQHWVLSLKNYFVFTVWQVKNGVLQFQTPLKVRGFDVFSRFLSLMAAAPPDSPSLSLNLSAIFHNLAQFPLVCLEQTCLSQFQLCPPKSQSAGEHKARCFPLTEVTCVKWLTRKPLEAAGVPSWAAPRKAAWGGGASPWAGLAGCHRQGDTRRLDFPGVSAGWVWGRNPPAPRRQSRRTCLHRMLSSWMGGRNGVPGWEGGSRFPAGVAPGQNRGTHRWREGLQKQVMDAEQEKPAFL